MCSKEEEVLFEGEGGISLHDEKRIFVQFRTS